jgi:hypothetical protein
MGQAKRKARKRAVRDIDDSANAEAGGERRHFDIPSSQRKVTVRSEVSFDDDKKKKYTFERTSGAQGEQWIEKAVEAVERKCMFSPSEKASELADILCGATLKLTTQSRSMDRSMDRIDGSMEKKKRTVDSDDVWRSFRKRDLIVLRQMSEREKASAVV